MRKSFYGPLLAALFMGFILVGCGENSVSEPETTEWVSLTDAAQVAYETIMQDDFAKTGERLGFVGSATLTFADGTVYNVPIERDSIKSVVLITELAKALESVATEYNTEVSAEIDVFGITFSGKAGLPGGVDDKGRCLVINMADAFAGRFDVDPSQHRAGKVEESCQGEEWVYNVYQGPCYLRSLCANGCYTYTGPIHGQTCGWLGGGTMDSKAPNNYCPAQ